MSTAQTMPATRVPVPGLEMLPKHRRAQIRRQLSERPHAPICTECRECRALIKPIISRPFCPGGVCRKRFLKRRPVLRVVSITAQERAISEGVLLG